MRKFIKDSTGFLLLLLVLFFAMPQLGSLWVESKGFDNGNTESNLLCLTDQKEFDLLFMGNSHARNFSRYNQHNQLEKDLDASILNVAQGSGLGGINTQIFYLKYLINQGYSFKHIIYTVSPPHLYGNHLDSVTTTFFNEPFDLHFLWEYSKHPSPNKWKRIFHNIKTKWKPSWVFQKPNSKKRKDDFLNKVDDNAIRKGFDLAFPNGLSENNFASSAKRLKKLILLAKSNGITITLLETPILFENWPGQDRLTDYCKDLEKEGLIQYLDLKDAVKEPKYFYDHHHLNTDGLEKLKSVLKGVLDY